VVVVKLEVHHLFQVVEVEQEKQVILMVKDMVEME
jgi:hypothetical protein|tara:strand:+ start:275 stop:379 length:105 start_codon:yes stop_codon:yes gene_type:complete